MAIGPVGAALVSIGMVLALFVTLIGTSMSGGRFPFAVSRDGYFFKSLADVHPVFHTPLRAIVVQAIVAIVLLLAGGAFSELLNLTIFAEWLFYMIAATTIFVFRRREPNLPRPYRTWGYPVVPAVFFFLSPLFLVYTFLDKLHKTIICTPG